MGQLKSLPRHRFPKGLQNLFEQIASEVDAFYAHSEAFSQEHLQQLLKEFFSAMREIVGSIDLSNKGPKTSRAKSFRQLLLDPQAWIRTIQKARSILQSDEVDDYGCDRRFEMAIKPFFDFLFSHYFRVDLRGIENIPSQGRALLVANHSGVLPYDAAMMKVAIYNEHSEQRELRFLVDDFVFHFPFLGVLMNRIGGVRACPENAERLLNHDEVVSVFPEGIKGIAKPFSQRYQLQRFGRGGTVRLALRTKSPIVPTAIIGAEEIHPLIFKSSVLARPLGLPFIPVTPTFPFLGLFGILPLPTKWTIWFGKPIYLDSKDGNAADDSILVNRETEMLRNHIQAMIQDLLKERRSVFFG